MGCLLSGSYLSWRCSIGWCDCGRRLPDAVRQNSRSLKSLLLEGVRHLLPPSISTRRDNQDFVFPFGAWLEGPPHQDCEGWQEGVSNFLRVDDLVRILEMLRAGGLHWSRAWALAALTGWSTALRV